jgi:ATPase subunit of ABC transporter with duplicated ATPase domains
MDSNGIQMDGEEDVVMMYADEESQNNTFELVNNTNDITSHNNRNGSSILQGIVPSLYDGGANGIPGNSDQAKPEKREKKKKEKRKKDKRSKDKKEKKERKDKKHKKEKKHKSKEKQRKHDAEKNQDDGLKNNDDEEETSNHGEADDIYDNIRSERDNSASYDENDFDNDSSSKHQQVSDVESENIHNINTDNVGNDEATLVSQVKSYYEKIRRVFDGKCCYYRNNVLLQ